MLAGLGVRDQRRCVVSIVVIHEVAAQRVEDGLALCDQPGGIRRHCNRCHRLTRNDPRRRENVEQTGADDAGHAPRHPSHRESGVARITTEANQRVAAVTAVATGGEASTAGPAFTAVASQGSPPAAVTTGPAAAISAPADASGAAGTGEPTQPADSATSAAGVADPAGAAGTAGTEE